MPHRPCSHREPTSLDEMSRGGYTATWPLRGELQMQDRDQRLRSAAADHDAGRLAEAERAYRGLLAERADPALLASEDDQRIQIGMRVAHGGKRMSDLAREFDYSNGSGIFRVVQRLEARARRKRACQEVSRLASGYDGLMPYIGLASRVANRPRDALISDRDTLHRSLRLYCRLY